MKAFYLRDKHRRPIALVGTERIDNNGAYMIHFSVATWNPVDVYSRYMAYEIVEGRLAVDRSIKMPLTRHIKREIIEYISNGYQPREKDITRRLYPTRTRNAAKRWLKAHPVSVET